MRDFLRMLFHGFIVHCWPNWLIRKITTCKDITWRVVNYDDLTTMQKFDLHWHMTFCQPCVDYKKQMELLSRGAKRFFGLKLTAEQEARLDQMAEEIIKKHSHHA